LIPSIIPVLAQLFKKVGSRVAFIVYGVVLAVFWAQGKPWHTARQLVIQAEDDLKPYLFYLFESQLYVENQRLHKGKEGQVAGRLLEAGAGVVVPS
jgi:hypothetical protein